MAKRNCVIVRAHGRELDQLRAEASSIAKRSKIGWWIERGDQGTHFYFEDAEAKKAFAAVCDNRAIEYREGMSPPA